jgi:hypothetical protein
VIEQMRHHLARNATEVIRASGRLPRENVPLAIIANHVASAQLGLATWWLLNGKPYPAPYMAQLSLLLTLNGLLETLGISDMRLPLPHLET